MRAIKCHNDQQVVTALQEANRRPHPTLQIQAVRWLKKNASETKSHTSLVVETTSNQASNNIIQQGFLHDGEIKTCERYVKEATITQCFRCQEYKHVAKACIKEVRCGYSSQQHETRMCDKQGRIVQTPFCIPSRFYIWSKNTSSL